MPRSQSVRKATADSVLELTRDFLAPGRCENEKTFQPSCRATRASLEAEASIVDSTEPPKQEAI